MAHHEILLKEYLKIRKSGLTLDQFIYLLKIYPSLLVCMSDGKLDDAEWHGVLHISKGIAQVYLDQQPEANEEEIEVLFRTEFKYLLENIDRWEKKFINTLDSFLEENEDEKEFVFEAMYLFANASDGISKEEQDTIDKLATRLSLEY